MNALWIDERDKRVWHRSVGRSQPLTCRAAYGWTDVRGTRECPVKRDEDDPRPSERYQACVAVDGSYRFPTRLAGRLQSVNFLDGCVACQGEH
jgi:hypothetical protein